jgi:hypothetical protein
MDYVYYAAAAGAGAWALSRGWSRLLLSRAKHPG